MNLTAGVSSGLSLRPRVVVSAGLAVVVGLVVSVGGPVGAALVVLGLVAFGAALRAPGIVFALYLLIPFYKGAAQPYSPVDITLVLALLNTIQIGAVLRERPAGHISHLAIAMWVALALLVLGGVLYAPDQTLALGHAASYWLLVGIPLISGALRVGSDPRYVRQLLWTFFGMGVLTTVAGVPLISSSDRLTVLGANTIDVASAAALVPILGVTFVARHATLPMRLATIVLIPIALVVALATGSRGPVLVLLAVAVLGVLRYLAHPRAVDWPRLAAVSGGIVGVVLLVSLASAYLPALSTTRFTAFESFVESALTGDPGDTSAVDTSAATRVELYGAALTMFMERPVLGFGTAGFEAMSHQLLGYDIAWPHDALLQFAAEFGIVGVVLFLGLVATGLVRRLPDLGRPVRFAFLFFLLEAMVSSDIFSDRTTWGLLLLLVLMEAPPLGRFATGGALARPEASDLLIRPEPI